MKFFFALLLSLVATPSFAITQLPTGTCFVGPDCKGWVIVKDIESIRCGGQSWQRSAKGAKCEKISSGGGQSSQPGCRDGSQCPGSQKCVRSACVDPNPPSDGEPQCQWNGDCSFPEGSCIGGVCSR